MENINITLETLYDILRNEKKREDLQKLDESFFFDVVSYLKEKKTFLETKKDDDNIFSTGEKDKAEYELRSIKRILKDIYEKREKKIIEIAVNKSKTGSDIIDTSSMLKEEKELYQRILKNLDEFRRSILLNLFKGEMPILPEDREQKVDLEVKKSEVMPESDPLPQPETQPEPEPEPQIELAKIKFTHPVPSFVWKDLKVYGPFDEGEETEIFPEVADLLVRKGRAEKL